MFEMKNMLHLWFFCSRDGPLIKVVKLKAARFAVFLDGRFDTADLSPHITYTFSFVIMLDNDDSEWAEQIRFKTRLDLPDGSSQEISHTLTDKPRNEWQKLLIGVFETNPEHVGHAVFFWDLDWEASTNVGITFKGILIQPQSLIL